MTSPLRRSQAPQPSSPLSPSKATTEEASSSLSIEDRISKTFLLLKELIDCSAEISRVGKVELPSLQSHLIEQHDPIVIEALGKQISRLVTETAESCSLVAKAIILNNISLENRLESCQLLTTTELSSLKSTLLDLQESGGSSSKRKDREEQTSSSLPLKKRKYDPALFYSVQPLPALTPQAAPTIVSALQATSPQCPIESIKALLTLVQQNKPLNFQHFECPNHSSPHCPFCTPFHFMLSPLKTELPQLKSQLQTLLEHTSLDRLASCLASNQSLQQILLNGEYFRNHKLALILEECDIGDSICSPNQPNPRTQAQIYSLMEELISAGPEAPFTQSIRALWRTTKLSKPLDNLTVALNAEGTLKQALTKNLFIALLPRLQRIYSSTEGEVKSSNVSKKAFSTSFACFLANASFATVQAIMESKDHAHLLIKTPSGKLVPSKDLLMRVCSLILCSNTKWEIRLIPCKASVRARHQLCFKKEITKLLHEEFLEFAQKNSISMSGSSAFQKKD
ncbi:hypothetical protein [Chlamydiifrater phoenicopteri]|uniref:hypothetical protein n=1 Tax=Chlamydiifrater phoenicopteri TaxID=2681469 RepID=UPI001BCD0B73|nr:hypothetical protein [Chlamydiifrater phoenicopteri]